CPAAPRRGGADRLPRRDARGGAGRGGGRRLVLLHPKSCAGKPPDWFAHAVLHARRLSPASGAQAIVANRPAALGGRSGAVAELEELWRLGRRVDDEPLLYASQFALDRLLASVAGGREARAFVAAQVGPLVAWDEGHGSGLLGVLE